MEITRIDSEKQLILKIKGRLDAYWSDHLSKELGNIIRDGADRILLDLSDVPYISSAGIRVFLSYYRQLKGIQGNFAIIKVSTNAKSVLEMSGLAELLLAQETPSTPDTAKVEMQEIERKDALFQVFPEIRDAKIRCRMIGNPELLEGCRFQQQDVERLAFSEGTFGLGLGAFGETFEECRQRFGEFLAVGGTAVYLPTDGTNIPDYMLSRGLFIPEINILYGAQCRGEFAYHSRFEVKKEGLVTLQSVVEACFDLSGADTLGIVMVAETAGLLGTALTRSPVLQVSSTAPFKFPEIREWLSFSSERSFPRSLALTLGLVDRSSNTVISSFLRPVKKGSSLRAHFHSAVFPFQPLKKGQLELKSTIGALFESEQVLGVMHLLTDDREIEGAGESEFIRGACWFGPISEISA